MAYEKEISKNYYLISVNDKRNISISRKLGSGDFIGRVTHVTEYAIDDDDSLLFVKTNDSLNKNNNNYYVLNMAKDYDYANIKDVVIGPLDSLGFTNNWMRKYKVKFVSISD